ncbi:MAG: DUF4139 domain-containing protein [Vicinamibacteria bacterium]
MDSRLACSFLMAVALPARLGAEPPALTIYNRDFAVVRERIPLDLKAGTNAVSFAGATVHLEPDSVVLRDPTGRVRLQVLEQSFRADTISQGLLLYLNEGKELDFRRPRRDGDFEIVRAKIIRSGYTPNYAAMSRFGSQFAQRQQSFANWQGGAGSPIVQVGGKLQFSLPGEPLFPELGSDAILYPTLNWQLASDRAARLDAELSYVTGGMRWDAAYNLVAPEKGEQLDIVGWVTLDNQSGKTFENAAIKLMAGDVSKIQLQEPFVDGGVAGGVVGGMLGGLPPVTEKAFDEFHLYTLTRPATLRNREIKQVELLRGERVTARTLYVYNGAAVDWRRYRGWSPEQLRNDRDYGTRSNPKVWVMREIANTRENGLGLPLPAGRTRFYRRDDDGRPEFTGENTIDHTPQGETLRVYTGDAFDVVGERKRTDYKQDGRLDQMEEAFEVRIRNRKQEPIQVRIAERLYRWMNWQIVEKSDEFVKTDAQNVEFRVTVPPDQEKLVSYRVRYDWR